MYHIKQYQIKNKSMSEKNSNTIDSLASLNSFDSTLIPASEQTYYGWYCEAIQQLRVSYPSRHKFEGKILISPPYCYWKQGNRKVLVTEVTNTAFPTPRQVKNGDIFLGPLDSYQGRTYRRLSEKDVQLQTPQPQPPQTPQTS
jgi:hypothetical protein